MHARILRLMRDKVRRREYVMTLHADDEMDNDGLTILDVESAILTGRIIESQQDRRTREQKYLVRGQIADGSQLIVVATKFRHTGKLVILTVYVE